MGKDGMIRVYIVEDEKLVRRGIIGLIDWAKYGMEVVGDAGSGEEAIGFLRRESVDLLFSDMEMPGLSGIEFLKKAKETAPDIQIIVLTMHQEFELIQQALRVGVLDYITKAQIEEDNPDILMERVRKCYLEAVHKTALADRRLESDTAFVWKVGEPGGAKAAKDFLLRHGMSCEELDEGHFLLRIEGKEMPDWEGMAKESGQEEAVVVQLSQVRGLRYQELAECLNTAIAARLFRDYMPGRFLYVYVYPELKKEQGLGKEGAQSDFWMNIEFMTDDAEFREGMRQICSSVSSNEERTILFYRLNLYWAEFSGKDITQFFQEVEGFKWWYQWKEWCEGLRDMVLERVGSGGTEERVRNVQEIHRAMNYIREHMDKEISLRELLQFTGMSKSHFSKNFKQITGKTFISYLNDIRIEAAKKYLVETRQPVSWIVEQVGFGDEHYFRKVFKRDTGLSPRAFRENKSNRI